MSREGRIGMYWKRWRAFCFAVVAAAVVWLVSAMAEPKVFHESYALHFDGIDTVRYAVTAADTTVSLALTSNGFYALRRSISPARTLHVRVAVPDVDEPVQQFSLTSASLADLFRSQVDMRGVSQLQPLTERVNLSLAERECRAFAPNIAAVRFEFDGMTGLCGSPRVEPDSVLLYGSRASLDRITSIDAASQTIHHIKRSGEYRVELEPVWEQYPDLRCSHRSVSVYIPTATYIEKQLTLPVKIQGVSASTQIKLYPAEVSLTCLVPEEDYTRLTDSDFSVTATLLSDTDAYLEPRLATFPSQVRVRSIHPKQIQYIIIK